MIDLHRPTARRRLASLLAATSLSAVSLATAWAPSAGAATAPVQVGLFGAQDPTYDGAFRQSLALLAYSAAGTAPPTAAVGWLLDQQCPDGGFQAFRSSTRLPCQKSDPTSYSGEDTNSTGIAAAALRAVGRTAAADRALAWVLAAQNTDGGFPYFVGGDSDANSTAVVLFGTNTAGRAPTEVRKGTASAAQFLESLQIGCDGAATDDDGGFAFQDYGSGLVDSDAATVQATLALSGAALPVPAGTVSSSVPRAVCPAAGGTEPGAAQLGAGHVARVLDSFDGAVPQFDYNSGSRIPGSVSVGDTAWAALSLAAVGVGSAQLAQSLAVLDAQPLTAASVRGANKAGTTAADQPGLLALAALATSAGGGSAATVDAYVVRIGTTMLVAPAASTPSSSASASPTASGTAPSTSAEATDPLAQSGATALTPVLAGVGGLLLLLGLGAVGSTRRRGAHA